MQQSGSHGWMSKCLNNTEPMTVCYWQRNMGLHCLRRRAVIVWADKTPCGFLIEGSALCAPESTHPSSPPLGEWSGSVGTRFDKTLVHKQ